jgi:hypothetical protein
VLQTREEKRVDILWIVWARNEATNEYKVLLVTQRWREIE